MPDWLIITVLAPLVAALLISGWFAASVFIIWIALLMVAVILACIIVLLGERVAHYTGRVLEWLRALVS